MKHTSKLLLLVLVITVLVLFNTLDLGRYLTLEYINSILDQARAYYQANPVKSISLFMLVYTLLTALSIPSAAVLTVLAGAIFGLTTGTLMVAVSATLGATLAFLFSRFLLQEWIAKRYANAYEQINKGIDKDGAVYLLSLRLTPIFPFFMINLVMGLTRMKTIVYALVSLFGMLPGTFIFVNAGRELSRIRELSDILTPSLIGSLTLIAVAPILFTMLFKFFVNRRKLSRFSKPKSFENDVIIIGAGSAGLVSAAIAAALKAKATLIERHEMGGDCLNTGCVPSKSLIRSARLAHDMRHASRLGIDNPSFRVNFPSVMNRVHKVIETIAPHDSRERFESLGVNTVAGDARVISPWEVQVGDTIHTGRNIILASGGRPFVPPLPGIEDMEVLTSDNLWTLSELPERLLIIGGGPIGCEMAQAFVRLGSKVTVVEMMDRILGAEDQAVSDHMASTLQDDGVILKTAHRAERFESGDGEKSLIATDSDSNKVSIGFDQVLIAIGRRANSEDLGLEELGIEVNRNGTVQVDEYLRTSIPTIYACGDLIAPWQFTHSASHEAWYCAVNALFSPLKKFRVDYSVMPRVTFTSPEVASVGVTEADCKEKGIDYQLTEYRLDRQDRALAEGSATGFVRVITEGSTDRILGATIVAAPAGEMLNEFTIAMKHKLGLNKLLAVTHPYPTWSEANKTVATEWKKVNAPQGALRLLARYFSWRRS